MKPSELVTVIKLMKSEIDKLILSTNFGSSSAERRLIKNLNNMFEQVNQLVDNDTAPRVAKSYMAGFKEAESKLTALGIDINAGKTGASMDVGFNLTSRVHIEAIAVVTNNMMMDLKSAIRTAKKNSNQAIMGTLYDVSDELQGGILRGRARKEITKRIAKNFQDDGFTSFLTKDGKRLPLDFYAETVTRTQLKEAGTQGAVNRYKETGHDLVKISGHNPTCHHCWNYRDVVFSLSGEDKRFPSARGGNLPPYHPNCMCSINVWSEDWVTEEEFEKAISNGKKHKINKLVGGDVRSKEMQKEYKEDQARKRRRNAERKDYARIKASLGDDAPKTLGAYRRMKSSGSDNYKELKRQYRRENPITKLPKFEKLTEEEMNASRLKYSYTPKEEQMGSLYSAQVPMTQRERFTQSKDVELGSLHDQDGTLVWQTVGNRNSADFGEAVDRGMTGGRILTHNHPLPVSFSPADISFMLRNNVAEMRAIDSVGTLYRARPPRTTDDKMKALEFLEGTEYKQAMEKTRPLIDSFKAGKMTEAELNYTAFDFIWNDVKDKMGIKYERVLPHETRS